MSEKDLARDFGSFVVRVASNLDFRLQDCYTHRLVQDKLTNRNYFTCSFPFQPKAKMKSPVGESVK